MLNMGGPASPAETGAFLERLFTDREIIQLGPLQSTLGPLLARRRTPRVQKQYESIGGSPIRRWTEAQGAGMVRLLDELSPLTAPHKFYIAFRYAAPLTEEALSAMRADGVERAVAFSQYPQFSCTTSGSSLNHLWRELKRLQLSDAFRWSVIDRWPTHPTFVAAVAHKVEQALLELDAAQRERAVILFSAHSLPMRVVARGDAYPQEVAASVAAVMARLRERGFARNAYLLGWQSQVGPLPWLTPQTGEALAGLGRQGHRHVVVVPIAFTTDHIETLFEIDQEYKHVADKAGITHFRRAAALNDEPLMLRALAEIAAQHLAAREPASPQYRLNCAGCVNAMCRSITNPAAPYQRLRDQAQSETP
jgi:ferrochelatase